VADLDRRLVGLMANQIVVIYWRDIPAQVNAQAGRNRHQHVLASRFQRAIDRAAIKAGKKTAHEYVAEWRRESRPCGDDLEHEMLAEVERIEAEYDRRRLAALVQNGGLTPGSGSSP
jgi:hypothetical protein